jgi:hypothetical protein
MGTPSENKADRRPLGTAVPVGRYMVRKEGSVMFVTGGLNLGRAGAYMPDLIACTGER